MKRFSTHLLPLLLPACMVDTPVVEGNNHEDLAAWCESACERVSECIPPKGPEYCSDDCASPAGPDPCIADCFSIFEERFVGKNEICSAGLGRIQDCIDEASCADLRLAGACNIDAESERCLASQGLVTCESGGDDSGGGGVTGGTGSGAGYAGTAGTVCHVVFDGCTNESHYGMTCTGSEPPVCNCLVNDELTRSFVLSGLECPPTQEVVELCAWPIVTL